MNKLFLFFLILLIVGMVSAEDQCVIDLNNYDSNCDFDTNFNVINTSGKIPLYFFYSDGCTHCHTISDKLTELEKTYSLGVVSIDAKQDITFFNNVVNDFKTNDYGVPKIVINNKLLEGDIDILANIENEIKICAESNTCELYKPIDNNINIGIVGISGLAIADAINPCALAVLLILLSAVLLKFSKKEVLKYGLVFIATVFVSYLLMGFILILGFKALGTIIATTTGIFITIFGIIAIIMGLLNLKDAISYGAGGFIMEVPTSWRPTMKKIIRDVTSVWSAVVIAFLVSFFLLPCTAGPYFLVSGLLHNLSWTTILMWLIYYNIIFIAPMLFMTLLVYFGLAGVESLEKKREKMIRIIHFIASIILIGMGIYLLLGI